MLGSYPISAFPIASTFSDEVFLSGSINFTFNMDVETEALLDISSSIPFTFTLDSEIETIRNVEVNKRFLGFDMSVENIESISEITVNKKFLDFNLSVLVRKNPFAERTGDLLDYLYIRTNE